VNKCFEVEIENDELVFDYKLRDGICKNKSASFLMKKMEIIG
jgi:DNA mismatch repair ATPase MutS